MFYSNSLTACIALALWGCGERSEIIARERLDGLGGAGDGGNTGGGDGSGGDEGVTGPVAPRFFPPTPVVELNDAVAKDQDPTLTEDQLEIFFFSDRGGNADIWRSVRADSEARWEPPVVVEALNSAEIEQNPTISRDGLRIWFYSRREPLGIYYAERPTRGESFGVPELVAINAPNADGAVIAPTVDASELRMAVSIGEAVSRDLYELVRPSVTGSWGEAVPLSGVNSDNVESTPFFVDDGREMFFQSGRSGDGDLYWSYRAAPGLTFTHVELLLDVNDPTAFESHPHFTADRRWLYFGSDRSGVTDIYAAEVRED